MKGRRLLRRARTCDAFPRSSRAGGFPNVGLCGRRRAGVFGEACEVIDKALVGLDAIEGTRLSLGYDRVRITIAWVDDGAVFDAWTFVKDRARTAEMHSALLEEHHLNPRYLPASERETDRDAPWSTLQGSQAGCDLFNPDNSYS